MNLGKLGFMARVQNAWLVSSVILIVSVGCVGSLARPDILKHPATPMVLLDDVEARVAVEDPPGSGKMVEYGVTKLEKGQTVIWYNWSEDWEVGLEHLTP